MESFFPSIPSSLRANVPPPSTKEQLCTAWERKQWGEPFMPDRRKLLVRDGIKYICYNANHVARPPEEPDETGIFLHVSPRKLMRPGWLNSRYPFLGHAPRFLRLEGLLHMLNDPRKAPLVEQTESDMFMLKHDVLANWSDVEGSIFALEVALREMTPPSRNPWSLEFRHYNLLSYYGYQLGHRSMQEATSSAARSRDAFRALIASTRMYIAINNRRWKDEIRLKRNAPSAWFDELLRSQFAKMTDDGGFDDRVGAFVHMDNLDSLSVIKTQITLGMPIWIEWGSEGDPLKYADSEKELRPYWEEFHPRPSETKDWPRPPSYSPRISTVDDASAPDWSLDATNQAAGDAPNSRDPVDVPAPYPDCGQLRGETPDQFISWRKRMLENRTRNEDPKGRQSRLDRAENAKKKMPPRRRGAVCFEWLESIPGHFLRTRIPRDEVEGVWMNYSLDAKIYDELKDEWDLWEGFDKNDGPTEGDVEALFTGLDSDGKPLSEEEISELESYIAHHFDALVPLESGDYIYSREASLRSSGRVLSAQALKAFKHYFETNASGLQQQVIAIRADVAPEPDLQWGWDENILETARLRFGYVERDIGDCNVNDVDDGRLSKCLAKMYELKRLATTLLSPRARRDIVDLVEAVQNSAGELRNVPESLCDLRKGNPRYLANSATRLFRVQSRDMLISEERKLEPLSKRMKRTSKVYFILPTQDEGQTWLLVLADPVSVLECMRFPGNEFKDLVRHLVGRGVPMHTLQMDAQSERRTSRQKLSGVLVRLAGTVIQDVDYIQYVQRVRSLVANNHRVGRAALMRGGIIWHLVIETVKIDDVLDGSSQESLGLVMDLLRIDGKAGRDSWYDDTLTSEEEDIICGVYRSSEEAAHQSEQLWSFWPACNVWDTSPANAGYWTSYNEEWFQARKRALLDPEAAALEDPRSFKRLYYQREWRTKLQGQKKAGLCVVKRNEELAEQFLDTI